MDNKDRILLGHGSGGKLTHDLISGLFMHHFSNPHLLGQTDAAIVGRDGARLAFTTDSYVVDPVFFPGGNIGKLAVCGTVNDIAVSGAIPLYISAGFIIEEGYPYADLEAIVAAMASEAEKAGVSIVTGDTKVVPRGKCDKIFINTAGVGYIEPRHEHIGFGTQIRPGDRILINGTIGDHGMAILAARQELNLTSHIESDCASLNGLIREILESADGVRFMRDATRGGLATVLTELAGRTGLGISIDESAIPVSPKVRAICEILGFDPLFVANEGKVVIVADQQASEKVLSIMQNHPLGRNASIIGGMTAEYAGTAWMNTAIGGKRILDMLSGEQLPRIC